MITPEKRLEQLIAGCVPPPNDKWRQGRFSDIKSLTTTKKGDIAEDFAVWLGQSIGVEAERNEKKRGLYDVKIDGKTLEVKMATEDVNECFQFNGVRYDTKYDLLLVIGISPNRVLFNIYPRRDLIDMPLVNMAKGTNATYKLTRKPDQLRDISDFSSFFNGSSNM